MSTEQPDPLDEKYLSQETREQITEVKEDLKLNPITPFEYYCSWWRANVEMPMTIHFLKTMIRIKHYFEGNPPK